MNDMEWVRKTHPDYIKGMRQHADELEQDGIRHMYGPAINRIRLLMEHIEHLEAVVEAAKKVVSMSDNNLVAGKQRQMGFTIENLRAVIKRGSDE